MSIRKLSNEICELAGLEKILWDDTKPSYRSLNARISNERIPLLNAIAIASLSDIKESWYDLLLDEGYRTDVPSVWLLEGLLMYLNEAQVNDLLSQIFALSMTGSYLGVDLVNIKALQGDDKMRKHWRSGFDEPEKFVGWVEGRNPT
ncbi:MAG: class I SAM-dependent methyltransferase [Rivularia sp. (in: cyanobacteria)]